MTTDVKTDLDLNQNQLLNAITHNVSSFPANPKEGQLCVKSHVIYCYLNGAWIDCGVRIATDVEASTGTAEDVAINPKQYALKANLASPNFTGTPTVPTAAAGTNTTQAASTAFVQQEISTAISNAVVYKGTWDTTSQTDFSGLNGYRPIKAGWFFRCTGTGCTIDGVEYKDGDAIIFNSAVSSGTTITSAVVDKYDSTESDDIVRLNTTQTLTNKTIDGDDNTVKDLSVGVFKSGEVVTSASSGSSKLITSGGVYSELQSYQTSLTFSTGLTNTSGTVTVDHPFIALSEGSIAVGGSGGTLSELSAGTNGQVLKIVSGVPAWGSATGTVSKETYTNPSLTPSAGVCTWNISDTLGSTDFVTRVYNVSTGEDVIVDITSTSSSSVSIQFNEASNVAAGTYKAVLIG